MIRDEAWLELSEISASIIESMDIQPQDALHIFLDNNPLASVVVQAVETPSTSQEDELERVLLHPTLFEFLSKASQLVNTGGKEEHSREETERLITIGSLPMEPLPLGWSADYQNQSDQKWVLRRIGVSEMREESHIYISCIYLESGVSQFTKGGLEGTESLFKPALEGRLIKKGCILLLSTLYGFAVVQFSDIILADDTPIDTNVVYRLKFHTSCQLHVEPPSSMPYEEVVETPLNTQWDQDIPGYESLLEETLEVLRVHGNSAAPSGILLTGCTGVGKSRLASCLAYHYTQQGDHVYYLSTQDLIFRAVTETDLFRDVILPQLRQCTVWIMDDLHLLERGDSDEEQRDVEYTIVQNSILQAIDLYCDKCRIVGIGQIASKLPNELTKIGRLEKNFHMLPPTQAQRLRIWENLLLNTTPSSTIQQKWSLALASTTAGCVVADLVRVYQNATTRSWAKEQQNEAVTLQWEELREAARSCIPSQLSELDVTKPAFFDSGLSWAEIHQRSWSEFGGYTTVKKHAFRNVVAPWRQFLRNMDELRDSGREWLEPPPGVLFHGPSGCGKTFAVQCLAASLELPMIQVRAADILDKWLGGSEALLRSLFVRARAASPCILFLDEIDSIANNRAEDDTNDFTSRILSTLLNEMDGVSSAIKKSRILVVACTNRLDALDSALLRPGRLQEHFFLGTPSIEDLVEILELRLSRIPLADNVSVEAITKSLFARNATGADVEGLCREVCLTALRRVGDPDEVVVSQQEFDFAIQDIGRLTS